MLSSAILYAKSKEKRNGGQRRGVGVCGREKEWECGKASKTNQWTAVGQAEAAGEQREGGYSLDEGRCRCAVHHTHVEV